MGSEFVDNSFPNTISHLLKCGNTVQCLSLFTDNKNYEEICNNAWDLIPIISEFLSEEYEIEVLKCCQELLRIISQQSKPEEVLLQFIEEIELATNDSKFLMLLKPLETVLLRLPDKRITSLAWCFNAIKTYLSTIEPPEDLDLEDEEHLLLDANESVIRIDNIYDELLGFCDTFVLEILKLDKTGARLERQQILVKFLVDLLGKPLGFLDMTVRKNIKSRARITGERLVEKFSLLCGDPYQFLELRDCDENSDLIKPNNLSLGVLFYLLFCEECGKHLPKVYDSVYIFQKSLIFVNCLLSQSGQLVVEKGVHLVDFLLQSVDTLQLSYLLLDSQHHSEFCTIISNIIIHNSSKVVRMKSLQVLQKYIWSFEHQGRYLILTNLMRILTHSNLKGYLTTQYKEMISTEINCTQLPNLHKYYTGRKLFNLLDLFIFLRNKEETDLVDESDQIVSTLNFLRYLLILDKENYTGINSYLDCLENGFLKQLRTGIEMSKEHYRLRKRELESKVDPSSDCQVSVTVSGKNIADIPKEKKMEIVDLSLTTLDVIDSLTSRVQECIDVRKNVQ